MLAAADPATAAGQLALALALGVWRGHAYLEFADVPQLRGEAARLEELRVGAVEDRVEAELATGAGTGLVEELTGLTERHPERERLWEQLMTALYRAGRQADALATFARARTVFVERFGLDPPPRLAEARRRVLANDAVLDAPAGAAAGLTRPGRRGDAARQHQGRDGAAHDVPPLRAARGEGAVKISVAETG